jgi:hypothetical protein
MTGRMKLEEIWEWILRKLFAKVKSLKATDDSLSLNIKRTSCIPSTRSVSYHDHYTTYILLRYKTHTKIMFSSKSILLLTVLATGSIAGSANDLLPRGNVQPMDLNMELEMNQEFDVVLPRAGETNFQVCF